jgi:hypothetical protein
LEPSVDRGIEQANGDRARPAPEETRITRLESTTTLTAGRAFTPHLPHRSVDDLVDPPLVTGTRLPPDLPDDQTELHRRGEQALDEGKLITRREGLRPPKHRVQFCAACRHDHGVSTTLDVSRPSRHHGVDRRPGASEEREPCRAEVAPSRSVELRPAGIPMLERSTESAATRQGCPPLAVCVPSRH